MRDSVRALRSKRKRYFSQVGEDGVLRHILACLPNTDQWCVEFGAWDGKYLSNTFYFITQKGYRSVLIELDPQRCELLRKNMEPYQAICLNAKVGFEGGSRLDAILSSTPIPKDFDLLSIDVDGDDYHIWNALTEYRPKVVIIEINVLDRPDLDKIHVPGAPVIPDIIGGTSIKSMTELALSKGYSLITQVGCNAIYVRNEYRALFHDAEVTPADVFTYERHSIWDLTWSQVFRRGWPTLFQGALFKIRKLFRFTDSHHEL